MVTAVILCGGMMKLEFDGKCQYCGRLFDDIARCFIRHQGGFCCLECEIKDLKKIIKRHVNLCHSCKYVFAECDGNPKFGNGYGNDNVYSCDKYVVHKEKE